MRTTNYSQIPRYGVSGFPQSTCSINNNDAFGLRDIPEWVNKHKTRINSTSHNYSTTRNHVITPQATASNGYYSANYRSNVSRQQIHTSPMSYTAGRITPVRRTYSNGSRANLSHPIVEYPRSTFNNIGQRTVTPPMPNRNLVIPHAAHRVENLGSNRTRTELYLRPIVLTRRGCNRPFLVSGPAVGPTISLYQPLGRLRSGIYTPQELHRVENLGINRTRTERHPRPQGIVQRSFNRPFLASESALTSTINRTRTERHPRPQGIVQRSFNRPFLASEPALTSTISPYQHMGLEQPVVTIGSPRLHGSLVRAESNTVFHPIYWKEFVRERNANEIFPTFLAKLEQHHRVYPNAGLPRRLEAIHKTLREAAELRTIILEEMRNANEACGDRAIYFLQRIETRCEIHNLINDSCPSPEAGNDTQIINALRTMYIREQLREHVNKYMEEIRGPSEEDVENHLYVENKLHRFLGLTGKAPTMCHTEIGHVPDYVVANIGNKLIAHEKNHPDGLSTFIKENDFWKEYIEKKYNNERDSQLEIITKEMSDLDDNAESMTSGEYNKKVDELMNKHKNTSANWLDKKSDQLFDAFLNK